MTMKTHIYLIKKNKVILKLVLYIKIHVAST